MKRRLTRALALGLVFSMAFSLITALPAFAQTDTTQEASDTGTKESTVTINSVSSFKVTVPSTITVSQPSKAVLNETYNVKVEGDITGTETIKVVPDETFNLTQTGKDNVEVTVTQTKQSFTYNEINGTNGCTTTGTLTTDTEVTAGTWTGSLTFNINVEAPSTGSVIPNLPSKVSNGTIVPVSTYSWNELQAISKDVQDNGSTPAEYGINIDAMNKDQLTKDGFTLVDAGTDVGDYPGFTFMGALLTDTGAVIEAAVSDTDTNIGGYDSSDIKTRLEDYYNGAEFNGVIYNYTTEDNGESASVIINSDIQAVIKPVNIVSNTGWSDSSSGVYNFTSSGVHVFLPSLREIGITLSGYQYLDAYALEGETFDYYKNGQGFSGNHSTIYVATNRITNTEWDYTDSSWLRSAYSDNAYYTQPYHFVRTNGEVKSGTGGYHRAICIAFVI